MATTLNDINNLVNDRRRDSGSTSVDMTNDGFRAVNGTIEIWQQMHDWEFTIEKQEITYNEGVTHYALNSDYKSPVDMRYKKGGESGRTEEFDMVSASNFDSETLKSRRFAIETTGQTEIIRIKASGDSAQVNTATTYDGDGTWTAGGHASNVTTDSYEFFELNGSTNFDFDGTSGTMTVTNMSAKDLRKFVDRSSFYVNFFLPTVTNFTSIAIRIGSGASAYYTQTQTADYLGDAPVTGWNKFTFNPWGSITGSPDAQNVNYIQFIFTYGGSTTDTDFRIENIFVSEDVPVLFYYYSTNFVQDAGDSTKRSIFNDSAATTDTFLWTGKWDFCKESFVNSVLEIVFWMTGEYEDMEKARENISKIVENLKRRIPSRRRNPELSMYVEQ